MIEYSKNDKALNILWLSEYGHSNYGSLMALEGVKVLTSNNLGRDV